jgi:hypothetical protein
MNLKETIFSFNLHRNDINKNKALIFILWAFINTFFLIKNGIVTTGEAEKYIGQSNLFIQTGHLSSSSLWLYFTQIALLSFCIKLHLSFVLVLIVQLVFNLVATFCFYRTLQLIFNSTIITLAGTIVLLLNQPYQEFNTFLQTESLFYSFSLILSCYVINIEKISFRNFFTIIFSLAIVSITRPTGLLFIPPVFIYLFFVFFKSISALKKITLLGLISLLFFFILNKALGSGGEFDFMLPFRDEDIICGLPSLTHSTSIKTSGDSNSVFGLLYYILQNFSQFIRLAWFKTIAFFGLYRSYFSKWHNIYLIIYFYSINIMAIASIAYWLKNHLYKAFYFLSVIFITWLTVILTCDDWHNRFYLSISPYMIILSMGFIKKFTRKK